MKFNMSRFYFGVGLLFSMLSAGCIIAGDDVNGFVMFIVALLNFFVASIESGGRK